MGLPEYPTRHLLKTEGGKESKVPRVRWVRWALLAPLALLDLQAPLDKMAWMGHLDKMANLDKMVALVVRDKGDLLERLGLPD